MIAKLSEKEQAISLRKSGMSVNKIAKKLSVAKSSASVWTREIQLSPEQIIKLKSRTFSRKATDTWIKQRKEIRMQFQKEGYEKSKEKDWRHAFACAIYMGEGDKTGNCLVGITNCDKNLLVFFRNFLKDYFNVKDERISFNFCCHLGNGYSIEEIKEYWSRELNLPMSCGRKPKIRSNNGTSTKYPLGIGRIYTTDVKIFQHIQGAIKGYLGKPFE